MQLNSKYHMHIRLLMKKKIADRHGIQVVFAAAQKLAQILLHILCYGRKKGPKSLCHVAAGLFMKFC